MDLLALHFILTRLESPLNETLFPPSSTAEALALNVVLFSQEGRRISLPILRMNHEDMHVGVFSAVPEILPHK